jgi:hypothetical protein
VAARFFVDENDLALGKALADLHGNVVFPGHRDLPEVRRRSLDDEWLAVIGVQGLVVITRDKRIRYRPVEKAMWIDHRVRGFVLTGAASQSTSDSLTLLEHHWAEMAVIVDAEPVGPWMYAVTQAGVRPIPLS